MNPQAVLKELVCPSSGLKTEILGVIPVHRFGLRVCKNGALYGECRIHGIRVFVRSRELVKELLKTAQVEVREEVNGS